MDRRPVMVDGGVRAASAALRQSPWIQLSSRSALKL